MTAAVSLECLTCGGLGAIDDPSAPLASSYEDRLMLGPPPIIDCPSCVDVVRCPRCGEVQADEARCGHCGRHAESAR